jgi:hypothetical protein
MKKILWKLLELVDNNHGYTTPIQKRFKHGESVQISFNKSADTPFQIGETVEIIEICRHDYLVRNINGVQRCVYQFELIK